MVSFSASPVPLIPVLNRSIVQRGTGEYFANKNDLISFIDSKSPTTNDDYLVINCQCGKQYIYSSGDQIPSSNVVCDCGRNVLIYGN